MDDLHPHLHDSMAQELDRISSLIEREINGDDDSESSLNYVLLVFPPNLASAATPPMLGAVSKGRKIDILLAVKGFVDSLHTDNQEKSL